MDYDDEDMAPRREPVKAFIPGNANFEVQHELDLILLRNLQDEGFGQPEIE